MSEQIREQVSAFLDGELPSTETDLLLKRLTRDAELRESFGRYALIGEACRGAKNAHLTRGLCARVNRAINGEGEAAIVPAAESAHAGLRWWRPMAGAAVAASVAVVAVFALQQRANNPPTVAALVPSTATSPAPMMPARSAATAPAPYLARTREPVSYTTPTLVSQSPSAFPTARLTNYVFAHSKYQSLLGQRDVLTDLIVDTDEPTAAAADKTQ
jgi:sigma-E factor negative regulatory protein RseA